jgi:hypothetical protein
VKGISVGAEGSGPQRRGGCDWPGRLGGPLFWRLKTSTGGLADIEPVPPRHLEMEIPPSPGVKRPDQAEVEPHHLCH